MCEIHSDNKKIKKKETLQTFFFVFWFLCGAKKKKNPSQELKEN